MSWLWKSSSSCPPPPPPPTTTTTKSANGKAAIAVVVDRWYSHDWKQAVRMQEGHQGGKRTQTRTHRPSPPSGSKTLRISESSMSLMRKMEEDLTLAYCGLEHADVHRDGHDLERALKEYTLSLELLVRVLKQLKTRNIKEIEVLHGGLVVDQGAIRARISEALSSAEAVKAKMMIRKKSGNNQSHQHCHHSTRAYHSHSVNHGVNDELSRTIQSDFLVDTNSLPPTAWKDISGLENVKQALQEAAILPLVRPDLFLGLRRPQNILLYGPPGTGKTMLVRAVAHDSRSCLFSISAAVLTSKWMGESEKLVRALFIMARHLAPSLIYIDEVDSLLSTRKSEGEHEASRRLKTEFMVQMDGIVSGGVHRRASAAAQKGDADDPTESQSRCHVLILACTNCPWDIDSAVLRRFPRRIYVPLPDPSVRRGLLHDLLHKAGNHHSLTNPQVHDFAQRLDGYSCSDITALASEASLGPLRSIRGGMDAIRNVRAKDVRPIHLSDFETAFTHMSKSVTSEHLARYNDWQRNVSCT